MGEFPRRRAPAAGISVAPTSADDDRRPEHISAPVERVLLNVEREVCRTIADCAEILPTVRSPNVRRAILSMLDDGVRRLKAMIADGPAE